MNAQAVNKQAAYKVAKILESDCPRDEKLAQLDQVSLWVMREHPDGWAAGVLQVVRQAETKVYGERRLA